MAAVPQDSSQWVNFPEIYPLLLSSAIKGRFPVQASIYLVFFGHYHPKKPLRTPEPQVRHATSPGPSEGNQAHSVARFLQPKGRGDGQI
jgi:hypothetical protein